MHTYISNQYREKVVDNGQQQVWLTLFLVNELKKRYPNAYNHAMMVSRAVYNMTPAEGKT